MRRPLIAAGLCAAVGAGLYLAAMHLAGAHTVDQHVLLGFMGLRAAPGAGLAPHLVALFNPGPFAILWAALVGAAVATGRRREGLAMGVAMIAACGTSQILKPLLEVPRLYMASGSWPSGHTTGVTGLALAAVFISAPRLRPYVAAAGGVLTVLTVYSLLLLGSHYPSDVLGGFLVALLWNNLALAALRVDAVASRRTLAIGPPLGAAALAALGGLFVATRPDAALAYASANTTFVAGALAIAAGALAVSGSVPAPRAAPRRPPPRSRHARG